MIPPPATRTWSRPWRKPRASGDDPEVLTTQGAGYLKTPRERG